MLTIYKLYFYSTHRFKTNPYFQNSLRMLRFAVLGVIEATLVLIKPDPFDAGGQLASFINWSSWVFWGTFLITIQHCSRRQPGILR